MALSPGIRGMKEIRQIDASNTPPVCWMTPFGELSIDFKLRFWIDYPQQGL
jgi:hypothetical protein